MFVQKRSRAGADHGADVVQWVDARWQHIHIQLQQAVSGDGESANVTLVASSFLFFHEQGIRFGYMCQPNA